MNIRSILVFALLFSYLYGDYTFKPSSRPKSELDRMKFHHIKDMDAVPQDPAWYAKQVIPISRSRQLKYDRQYNNKYFAPWSMKKFGEPVYEMEWPFRMVQKKAVYDSKYRQVPKKAWEWWIKNSNFSSLDTVRSKGITIRHTNLRALPTMTPAYRDPHKNTEGFPFDYNQNSAIYPNVPLYISHYSLDKKWAFVHTPDTYGWIKLRDIALVDKRFMRKFQTGKYAVAVRDNMRLYNGSRFVSYVKIGTIFPILQDGKQIAIAQKNSKAKAKIVAVKRPAKRLIADKPISFVPNNISYIARELKKDPYGWGGIRYGRDCSATTRDFFGVFGIFLRRNSSDQAKDGAKVIDIKKLKGRSKKDAILANAKPFRSLLFVPGHIALYIGRYKNEPVIMHTYWGIRLNDFSKYTLSHTIITTTEPGKEIPNIRKKSMLSNTLQKIITF